MTLVFLPFLLLTLVSARPLSLVSNLNRSIAFDESVSFRMHHSVPRAFSEELGSFQLKPEKESRVLEAKRKAISSLSSSTLANSAPFTCEQLPGDFSPYLFCSGVVDYSFFVPSGQSISDLDQEARTAANYYPTTLLSTSCLNSIKRDICAMIFLPCVSNVVPGDVSTYMKVENNVSLPYLRPCSSLCNTMDATCGGLLEMFGLNPYCDYLMDPYNSLVSYYDSSSTPLSQTNSSASIASSEAVCNDLPASQDRQVVASASEPYIGEICRGIVESYYVPAPSTVDASFAPLLPPFVLQTVTETALVAIEKMIPQYFSSACLLARRELMCSTFFLAPYENLALAAYFGPITLPSFPDRSLCLDYWVQCQDMIDVAPVLAMNCSEEANGVQVYPSSDQVIFSLPLGQTQVPLTSPPHQIQKNLSAAISASLQLETQCPYGFHPTPPGAEDLVGSLSITGTACSLACPIPIYTSGEYDWMFSQTVESVWVSLVFTFLQTINLAVLKPQKQNIFLVCFIMSSFLFNILKLIQVYANHNSRVANVCENETQTFSLHDPHYHYQNQTGYSLCAISSVLGLYLNYFYWWILFALSSEIWCRVVWGMKKVETARRLYMLGSALLLIFLALFATLYDDPDINSIGSVGLFCSWSFSSTDLQFYLSTLPGILIFSVSFAMIAHSIFVCLKTSLSIQDADRKPMLKIWKSYSMLILFLVLEIAVNPISIFYFDLYLGYVTASRWANSVNAWAICIFQTFVSSADSSYLEVCGWTSKDRMTVIQSIVPYAITTYLNAIVLFLITLNKEVKSFWWTLGVWLLSSLGARHLLSKQLRDKYLDASRESNILNNKNFRRQRQTSFSKITTGSKTGGPSSPYSEDKGLVAGLRDSLMIHVRHLAGSGGVRSVAVLPLSSDKDLEAGDGELQQTIADKTSLKHKPLPNDNDSDSDNDSEDEDEEKTGQESPSPQNSEKVSSLPNQSLFTALLASSSEKIVQALLGGSQKKINQEEEEVEEMVQELPEPPQSLSHSQSRSQSESGAGERGGDLAVRTVTSLVSLERGAEP